MTDRKIGSFIFVTVFSLYLISPVMVSADSRWVIHTALSMIKEGNTDLDEYSHTIQVVNRKIVRSRGHFYQHYPIGPSLIALPFVYIFDQAIAAASSSELIKGLARKYLAGYLEKNPSETARFKKFIARYVTSKEKSSSQETVEVLPISVITIHPFVEKCISSFLMALAAVFMYLIARMSLGISYSLLMSFIFSFCTLSWSMASRALWHHSPAILMVAVTLYLLLLFKHNGRLVVWSAVPIGMLFMIRPQIAIIFLTVYVFMEHRKNFLFYCLIVLTIIGLYMGYSFFTYGSFLEPYYLNEVKRLSVHKKFLEAFAGNLFSPARGILVYSPVFLFSLWGMFLKVLSKERTNLDFYIIGIVVAHFLSICLYNSWHGSWSFGQRYFSEMIPYMLYFLVYFVKLKKPFLTWKGREIITNGIFIMAITFSFFINFKGATDIDTWLWNERSGLAGDVSKRIWDWQNPPFLQ